MHFSKFNAMAVEAGLTAKDHGNGHYQLKGGFRVVNYYPSKMTVYIAGAFRGYCGSVEDAIQEAKTEDPAIVKAREYAELLQSGIGKSITCPHCLGKAMFYPDSKHLYYGRDYGPIYHCLPCNAYVGCHDGTITALGTPADRQTREARKAAHEAFDQIWQSRRMTRPDAYAMLQKALGLTKDECHIGLFDIEMADRVVEVARQWREEQEEKEKQQEQLCKEQKAARKKNGTPSWNVYCKEPNGVRGEHLGTVDWDEP